MGTSGFSSVPTAMVMSNPSSVSSIRTSWIQASSLIRGPCIIPSTVRTVSASSTIDPGMPARSDRTWTCAGAGPSAGTTSSTTPDRARCDALRTVGPAWDSERAKVLTARSASPAAMARASA